MAMFLVLKSDVLCLKTLVLMGYERSLFIKSIIVNATFLF